MFMQWKKVDEKGNGGTWKRQSWVIDEHKFFIDLSILREIISILQNVLNLR